MLLLLWQYDAAFSHTLKDKNLEVNKYIIKTNPKKFVLQCSLKYCGSITQLCSKVVNPRFKTTIFCKIKYFTKNSKNNMAVGCNDK